MQLFKSYRYQNNDNEHFLRTAVILFGVPTKHFFNKSYYYYTPPQQLSVAPASQVRVSAFYYYWLHEIMK
jgi:hypothetical protein